MATTTQTTHHQDPAIHEIDREYCARVTLAYLKQLDEKKARNNTDGTE